jgi:hypothetical protein
MTQTKKLLTLAGAVFSMTALAGCVLTKDPNAVPGVGGVLGGQKGIKVQGDDRLTAAHVVLGKYCYQCHANYKQIGVDGAMTALLVVAGKPLESKLFAAITGSGGSQTVTPLAQTMPLGGLVSLSDEEISAIGNWITKLSPSALPSPKPTSPAAVPKPVFASISPASPSNSNNSPVVAGTLELNAPTSAQADVTTVSLFRDADCTQLIRSGSLDEFASPGLTATVPLNKTTSIYGQASTAKGNVSSCALLTVFTHDNVGPAAPTLSATLPAASTSATASQNTNPVVKGSAAPADAAKIRIFTSAGCSGMSAAEGTPAQFLGAGISVGVQAMGTTVLSAAAVDSAGNQGACSSGTLTYITASTGPANPVASSINPAATSTSPTNNRRPTIAGTAPNNGATASTSVKIYSDSGCATEVGSTASINATTKAFSVALSADIAAGNVDKDIDLYGKAFAGTVASACVKLTGSAAAPSYRLDTTPPNAPTYKSISPTPPIATGTNPQIAGGSNSGDASFVYLYLNNNCAGTANASGTVANYLAAGLALNLSSATAGTVQVSGMITDKAGNGSACQSLTSFSYGAGAAERLAAAKTILRNSCVSCHGDFDNYATDAQWIAATHGGKALVKAGDPANSSLFTALANNGLATPALAMPLGSALPADQINTIKSWIAGITAVAPPSPIPSPTPSTKPSGTPSSTPSGTPVATTTTLVDDNDAGWTYGGGFFQYTWDPEYKGGAHGCNAVGCTAEYSFYGVGIDVVAWKGPNGGAATVAIDGASAGTISFVNSTETHITKLFGVMGLTRGNHKIKITSTVADDNLFVMVDQLAIYDQTVAPSPRPSVTPIATGNPQATFACSSGADPGPTSSRRLSKEQYRNTLRDLLKLRFGSTSTDADSIMSVLTPLINKIPDDSLISSSDPTAQYSTVDDNVTDNHFQAYFEVTKAFIAQVTSSSARIQAFGGNSCLTAASVTAACRDTFINDLGLQMLRRPVSAGTELTNLQNAFSGDTPFASAVGALLLSPQFLFRIEDQGTAVNSRTNLFNISQYELASRLSYSLWLSMPDAALFTEAKNGTLATNLATQVDRMIADAKAKTAQRSFFGEWTKTPHPPQFTKNVGDATYNAFAGGNLPTANLTTNANNEVLDLLDYYTNTASNGKIADAFLSPYSFAKTSDLAAIYNVSTWNGNSSQMVTFPNSSPRSGLLTRTAILGSESFSTRPIIRGVYVKRRILCDTLGAPPADFSGTMAAGLGPLATKRQQVEQITSPTTCNGCHSQINPFAFALESYDSLGRYREKERIFYPSVTNPTDVAIDTFATVALGNGLSVDVNDGATLSQAIVASGKVEACFSRNYFSYVYGRAADTSADACALESIRSKGVGASGSLRQMFRALTTDPSFKLKKLAN